MILSNYIHNMTFMADTPWRLSRNLKACEQIAPKYKTAYNDH